MSDPVSKEDLEKSTQIVLERLGSMSEKSSQEHGAVVTRIDDQNRETRAHIASEVETMRADVAHTKNYMGRVLKAIKRFLNRMGVGTDDL